MKIIEILLEYDRNVTASKLGAKILQIAQQDPGVDTTNSNQAINAILDAIENKDPTPNKNYSQWLATLYAQGNLNINDIDSKLLTAHSRGKQKKALNPIHNDINRFKSYQDFETTMNQYDLDELIEKSQEDRGSATVLHKDNQVIILIPHDVTAACYYGRGTQWCTAATRTTNHFDSYNQQGPLFILLPRKPQYPRERYQLQFETGQFVNDEDHPQTLKTILKNRLPTALNYFRNIIDKTKYPAIKKYPMLLNDTELWNELKNNPKEIVDNVTKDVLEDRKSLFIEAIQKLNIAKQFIDQYNSIIYTDEHAEMDQDVELAIVRQDPHLLFNIRKPGFEAANLAIKLGLNRKKVRKYQLFKRVEPYNNIPREELLKAKISNSQLMANRAQKDVNTESDRIKELQHVIEQFEQLVQQQPNMKQSMESVVYRIKEDIKDIQKRQQDNIRWIDYYTRNAKGLIEIADDLGINWKMQ